MRTLLLLWTLFAFTSEPITVAFAQDDVEGEEDAADEVGEDSEVEEDEGPQIVDGFTPEEIDKMAEEGEKFEFQAEVSRLMDIIINALYTNREIFIRELISNSADALEKVRFNSIQDPEYLGEQKELKITIETDTEAKTIEICDTGVGMTKQELVENLGTVAKSGTTNFLEALQDKEDAGNLIGQFGVGFYSAFLIADKIHFKSKSVEDMDHTYVWSSSADGMFSIFELDDPNMKRGSCVKMFVKDDASEFLSIGTLEKTAKKYSQFMQFGIYVPDDSKPEEDADEDADLDDDDEDAEKKEEAAEPEKKWKQINNEKPIWLRSKEDITEEEYHDFYKAIAKDVFEPLAYTHFSAEGDIEFSSILYIPKRAPPEMSIAQMDNWECKVKMYVRRVLVAEKVETLLPRYLKWVQGVVDSDDMPLNVSREQLQQSKVLKVISKKLTRKVLEMLKKLSKDQKDSDEDDDDDEEEEDEDEKDTTEETAYEKFYKEFKHFLLLGCQEDDSNRSKLSKLLRYASTFTEQQGGGHRRTSLEQYHKRMKEDQAAIYYAAGDSVAGIMREPGMEIFKKRDLEVLFMTDAYDEHCIKKVLDFEGVKMKSIQKAGDLLINWSQEENQRYRDLGTMYRPLTKWWSSYATDTPEIKSLSISRVELSRRLVNTPAIVVSGEFSESARGERMTKGWAKKDGNNALTQKTLELNADHPVVYEMLKKVQANPDDEDLAKIAGMVTQSAVLNGGFDLEDSSFVVDSVYKLLSLKHGLDPNAEVSDVEIDIIETEEESADEDDVIDDEELGADLDELNDMEAEEEETPEGKAEL